MKLRRLLVVAPLIWWGGLASFVAVQSRLGMAPPLGDAVATVLFAVLGLLLMVAFSFFHRSDLRVLVPLIMTMLIVTGVAVSTNWEGGWFYIPVGLFAVGSQAYMMKRSVANGESPS